MFGTVVRAPLKRTRVDDAGTSSPTAEEVSPAPVSGPVLSPAPVSGPIPADFAPEAGVPLNDIPPPSPEMALAPLVPADPVVLSSGDGSQGAAGSGRSTPVGADLASNRQPSVSSDSVRRGESPTANVWGTAEMVKVRVFAFCVCTAW